MSRLTTTASLSLRTKTHSSGLVGRGVDLLVRHIGRDEDEIAGLGLGDVFEVLAPAHPRLALQHVDDAFEGAVMVRAGLGVGVDMDRAGPDLLRPDPGEIDRRGAVHARGLRRVGVELIARDHLDAVRLPVDRVPLAHLARPRNLLGSRGIWCGGKLINRF